ncbi:MAG: DNA polymerase III subunit gamma/tau [Candidatus Dojkabacteria bacterium]|nr:DNA polymerase III subunit gamma/tau [Candidatus Dojkabacteria bacterium]
MSSEVLYRKYRATSFREVYGQEIIVNLIKNSIINKKISHAYLFCGPHGVGKTSLARIFAKAVNCKNFDTYQDVCNECDNCKLINLGQAIDIQEIDAASNRRIDDIRNIIDTINYLPRQLYKKIYIMDEVHMLTKEAFNALLKILEEPPDHVLFLLATTEPHKVPLTILSRVTRLNLTFLKKQDLINKIKKILDHEQIQYTEKSLEIIYDLSHGSLRDAESILFKIINAVSDSKYITEEVVYNTVGLTAFDKIESLVQNLIRKKYDLVQKDIPQILVYESNIEYIVESMMSFCTKTIIHNFSKEQESFLDKSISFLLDCLIELRSNLKNLNNKELALDIFLIKYFGEDISSTEMNNRQINNFSNVTSTNNTKDNNADYVNLENNLSNLQSGHAINDESNLSHNTQHNLGIDLKQTDQGNLVQMLLDIIKSSNKRLFSCLSKSLIDLDITKHVLTINADNNSKIILDNVKYQNLIKKAYIETLEKIGSNSCNLDENSCKIIINYISLSDSVSKQMYLHQEMQGISDNTFSQEREQYGQHINMYDNVDNSQIIENIF